MEVQKSRGCESAVHQNALSLMFNHSLQVTWVCSQCYICQWMVRHYQLISEIPCKSQLCISNLCCDSKGSLPFTSPAKPRQNHLCKVMSAGNHSLHILKPHVDKRAAGNLLLLSLLNNPSNGINLGFSRSEMH